MKSSLFLILLGALTLQVSAQDVQKRVLVLHAPRSTAPMPVALDREYQRILGDGLGGGLDFHSEYLDVARFAEPDYQTALREFLAHKYRNTDFDLVMATSDASVTFVHNTRDELFEGVPLVAVLSATLAPGENATGVRVGLPLDAPIVLALHMQPDTRQVFVVSGASAYDKYYEDVAREQLASTFKGRVGLTYLTGLTMRALEDRISRLPPQSIIYVVGIAEDGAGDRFLPVESLDLVTRVANAPVYTWLPESMNHGIVGGSLMTAEVVAARTADLALRVLRGEPASGIPVGVVDPMVPQVDWRQLQRWKISEAALPAGTAVMFRAPGLWDQYKPFIVGAIALMVLQTALISALLAQRARRQQAEDDRRDLAGRLISAQEAERAHIARELHDDFGQRLASFSIAVSGLKRQLVHDPGVANELAVLHEGSMKLSKDLRLLSHGLHPGLLQHLGLVEALRMRAEEVCLEHGIQVAVDVEGELGDVPDDAALCLYRVAQEALQNVVKHSGARSARLSLGREARRMVMHVEDNGKGFSPGHARRSSGLGLHSLDERVKMAGGRFSVESSAGTGTTVRATIPV